MGLESILDFNLNGMAYGVMPVFSWTSLFVNLYSIFNYGTTRMNMILVIADVTSILRSSLSLSIIQNRFSPFVIVSTDFLLALNIGILALYPTLRYLTMLEKYPKILGLVCPPALFVVCFLRAISVDEIIDKTVPAIMFYIVAPPAYLTALYCFYQIGNMIRNNPGAQFDIRQLRLEKLSNMLVWSAGLLQLGCIIIAFTPVLIFVKSAMALNGLVLSASDLLMVFNKNTETDPVVDLFMTFPIVKRLSIAVSSITSYGDNKNRNAIYTDQIRLSHISSQSSINPGAHSPSDFNRSGSFLLPSKSKNNIPNYFLQ